MAIGGTLRTDFTWGMGVEGQDGRVVGVVWPYGWTLSRDSLGYVLVDRNGQPVAHEGDTILMAGTIFDDVLRPCDPPDLSIIEMAPR